MTRCQLTAHFPALAVGFVMGMVFGVLTRFILRYMRYLGASHDQEVALTLGMAYLAYWVTGQPCKGSGMTAETIGPGICQRFCAHNIGSTDLTKGKGKCFAQQVGKSWKT